mmetsp:Transcript_17094/g.48880  ORF Transcript_17094/g.48880 Transcript_17094/m.48880 type:complete len:646 (-) Transcript_17094:757-2694(-)
MEAAPADRPVYASKVELLLSLVGYAVGLGNIWRFPYLVFTYGGSPFLIPYFVCLALLGLPLFILEMGLGQIYRQGSLGVWEKMGLPRFRGIGAASTIASFFVGLYYNVILAWTIYYLGRTILSIPSGVLPWSDQAEGYTCPPTVLFPKDTVAGKADLLDSVTGLFNPTYQTDFWCPAVGIPTAASIHEVPSGFVMRTAAPTACPARAAAEFWSSQALQQSTGLDDLGGFNYGLLVSFVLAWLLVYLCVFKGIQSSGKVVYVTALLPYVILGIFFVRAITLPNAGAGVAFYLQPDFSKIFTREVWMRAANQIFYSLGVGFGSIIAFASYAPGGRNGNFVKDATLVSFINCGTSFFGGFVVFPILGYLAHELSSVNPCIQANDLMDLTSIGMSGTGLAFIAFPIAIARMPGGFFWALLFFLMLLCLGIDSQFAMVESVVTVLSDAGVGSSLRRPVLVGIVCTVSYLLGLIFVTRGGIYWFELFDNYSCVLAMFFVTAMECFGLMWFNKSTWPRFQNRVRDWTGATLGWKCTASWKFICPALIVAVTVLSLNTWDIMGARDSQPFPQGRGHLPEWSIWLGWSIGLLPIVLAVVFVFVPPVVGDSEFSLESCGADGDNKEFDGYITNTVEFGRARDSEVNSRTEVVGTV